MENRTMDANFQMKISSLNVLEFSQYEVGDFDVNKDNPIEYQTSFAVGILEESSQVSIEATVKLKVQELDKYFGELKTIMKFVIIPFDAVITKDNKGFHIPDMLLSRFFNIVAGTIRGILSEKLRGTILQNEIFPLIDVRELTKRK